MISVAIIGARGFLGRNLSKALDSCRVQHISRADSVATLEDYLLQIKTQLSSNCRNPPEIIINCAAITDAALCDKDPNLAEDINSSLAGHVSNLALDFGSKFVHISSDAVIGHCDSPAKEHAIAKPLSVYGKTKLLGEEKVLNNPNSLIVRTNFFGSNPQGKSVFDYFARQDRQGPLYGFVNYKTSSVHISSIVQNLTRIVENGAALELGPILHLSSEDYMSKYEFGVRVAELLDLPKPIPKILDHEPFNLHGRLDLLMDSSKAKSFGFRVEPMADEIELGVKGMSAHERF